MRYLPPLKPLFLAFSILNCMGSIWAQDVFDKALFFNFTGKQLEFFSEKYGLNGSEPLEKSHVFSLGSQFTNIYMNWLNPLKYQVKWKDTTYSDERDKVIRDFIAQLAGQFKLPAEQKVESKGGRLSVTTMDMTDEKREETLKSDGVFFNSDLAELKAITELYWSKKGLTHADTLQVKQIEDVIGQLDKVDFNNAYPYSQTVKEVFNKLSSIDNAGMVLNTVEIQKGKIEDLKNHLKDLKADQESIPSLLEAATQNNTLPLSPYTKSVVSNFLKEVKENLAKNENLVSKTDPIFEEMKNSIKDSSERKGYYRVKRVKFDEGSVFETQVTITEYQFNPETIEFSKKSEVYQSKIIFQRYDWVQVSVGTGIFYSSVTIKGFGVAAKGNGGFTVTENSFTKNSAIPGLFLNLNFYAGSRYFSPSIQLGVDPTKTHPYFLLGAGFAIPSTKFSLAIGPVWAWSPRLEDLEVGGTVNSTTDLEKKIKYDINIAPNGWYLGILYQL